jgi:hypothetical protein
MNGITLNMDITVQTLNILAMFFAMIGSALFVHGRFEDGAKTFLLGNAINIAVALSIGDVAFGTVQAVLGAYTLPMYKDTRFNRILACLFAGALVTVGVSSGFHFRMDLVSVCGAVFAIIGAHAMYKQNWKLMAWMWIVADLIFIQVGVTNGLVGLTLQSMVFVYHGILRVTGVKQTGLFTFTRS